MSSPESPEEGEYVSKWNILFDRTQSHWMLVNPEEGTHVYPCYACRDLFSSKASFVDHINRISIALNYDCATCDKLYHFYNPCTLLLHARKHFTSSSGIINLDDVSIDFLPLGLIGFPPHPDIPLMFNFPEEETTNYINSSFYNPMGSQKGCKIIKLVATYLLFLNNKLDNNVTMVLKQICTSVPKCVFVITNHVTNSIPTDNTYHTYGNNNNNYNDVKYISTVENKSLSHKVVNNKNKLPDTKEITIEQDNNCPECNASLDESRTAHFRQENVPTNYDLQCSVCSLILPGKCAFTAHSRLHLTVPPFVCPECGTAFDNFLNLAEHLDISCYHFSKQIRMKCTKKHCAKIFSSHINYRQHFATHFQAITTCTQCNVYFLSHHEYFTHKMENHKDEDLVPEVTYRCTDCEYMSLTQGEQREHIAWHCDPAKLDNRVYVYLCHHCRSYFRTTVTYATHIARCNKKNITLSELVSMKFAPTMTYCTNCNFIVHFKLSLTSCPKCGGVDSISQHVAEFTGKKFKCTLCNEKFPTQLNHLCKFEKPIVVLNHLGNISNTIQLPDHTYGIDWGSKSSSNDKIIEKRKRKSTSPSVQISKKKSIRASVEDREIKLEAPKPFDGTYCCKLCDFITEVRSDFHNHLRGHRNGTVYQCMECGESFVVKPSFEKHLIYFHQIVDVDKYIAENDCCDKNIENLLQKNGVDDGSNNEPLEENQCKVCRQKFDDEFELKKHFRVHGMAFILNKGKANN